MSNLLHARWLPMRPHPVQYAYYHSEKRFCVVPAGRRSGKTEIAKRRLIKRAVGGHRRGGILYDRPRYFAGAPTRDQAKRIFWDDLKRMMPKDAMRGRPSESELVIPLWHGGELFVLGMDVPERIEGAPINDGLLDEYGNIKEKAWGENVRPALSERDGRCDLTGVPEGRNHYYKVSEFAKGKHAEGDPEWGHYHWVSADILPAKEIEAAKRELDPLTFAQEYEASFVTFAGRAYYAFTDSNKLPVRQLYDPTRTLIICLDFNVEPGVAAICQEIRLDTLAQGSTVATCVIGQVWIENNSNTPAVCRKLLADWKNHSGSIEVYGDATGGARGTAQTQGSDWDIAKNRLRKGDGELRGFGDRVSFYIKSDNPSERARVNAVNTRCCNGAGIRRTFVDPIHADRVVQDLEGVVTLDGGSGEIDKKKNKKLTHISDAFGYYIDYRFPIVKQSASVTEFVIA